MGQTIKNIGYGLLFSAISLVPTLTKAQINKEIKDTIPLSERLMSDTATKTKYMGELAKKIDKTNIFYQIPDSLRQVFIADSAAHPITIVLKDFDGSNSSMGLWHDSISLQISKMLEFLDVPCQYPPFKTWKHLVMANMHVIKVVPSKREQEVLSEFWVRKPNFDTIYTTYSSLTNIFQMKTQLYVSLELANCCIHEVAHKIANLLHLNFSKIEGEMFAVRFSWQFYNDFQKNEYEKGLRKCRLETEEFEKLIPSRRIFISKERRRNFSRLINSFDSLQNSLVELNNRHVGETITTFQQSEVHYIFDLEVRQIQESEFKKLVDAWRQKKQNK